MTFKAGVSGNPTGKKPGCGRLQKLRQGLEKDLPGILATLTTQALAVDPVSARLILDRCLPALRPESRSPAPAPTTPDEITSALATGQITIDQGAILMEIASARVRVMEGQELLDRIETLENLLHKS